ncbi:MAG TPA: DNA-processing protein DprA [Candidatus Brocadiia bacterium]|nr:DNA-processing protein DprA [Candidatus Brocadiia bacterium]
MADGQDILALLQIVMTPKVGPRTGRALIEHFGSAAAVLKASRRDLQEIQGIGGKIAENIQRPFREEDAEAEMNLARDHNVKLIAFDEEEYPDGIRRLGDDAPLILYIKGNFIPQDDLAIAIVGSRAATHYGRKAAKQISFGIASAGVTIISGLARGIDGVAHQAALDAKGRTIAVVGNGLATVYPAEHKELAEKISANGAVISELPMKTGPEAGNFAPRNRLISALSHGVVIVEAGLKSGTLMTANWALEQGKEVFAVPGNIDSPNSQGTHRLIKEGARLVENAEDVLRSLGPLPSAVRTADDSSVADPRTLSLKGPEKQVFDVLDSVGQGVDELIQKTGLTAPVVNSVLTILVVKRLAQQIAGQRYVRAATV